jgi:hypothetical protein
MFALNNASMGASGIACKPHSKSIHFMHSLSEVANKIDPVEFDSILDAAIESVKSLDEETLPEPETYQT